MNTGTRLKHQGLTGQIIGVFLHVYNELGAGFFESVYVKALSIAFSQAGLSVEREMPLAVRFRGTVIGDFRADLVVGGKVLVETKACPCLISAHSAQVLNYLRATVLEVGLLLNFGPKPSIKRFVFDNSRKAYLRNDSWCVAGNNSGSQERSILFPHVSAALEPSLAPPD